MIKEYEYLHGVVFNRLCSAYSFEVSIKPLKEDGYSSYVLNKTAGLHIKYSSKRLTPWRFTFSKANQDEILIMKKRFGEVFVALVCNLDGVVVLDFDELKALLDIGHDENEWLSISRRKNKMYSVAAANGKLDFKIGMNSCPDKIVDYLKKATNRLKKS